MACDIEETRCPADADAVFVWLHGQDARWQAMSVFGVPAFKRVWGDGTEDVVFALRDGHGYGVRHAPDGRLARSMPGSLHHVAELIMGLDPPGSLDAPQPLASAPHRGDW